MTDESRFMTILEEIGRREKHRITGCWFNLIEVVGRRFVQGPVEICGGNEDGCGLALIGGNVRIGDLAGFWPETEGRIPTAEEAEIIANFISTRKGGDVEVVVPLRNRRPPVRWSGFDDSPQHCVYREQIYPCVLDSLKDIEFSDVLDVGCGAGDLLHAISRTYPRADCHGIDSSSMNTASAKEKGLACIYEGDARNVENLLPAGKTFDLMIFCGVLNRQVTTVGSARNILKKCIRVLRYGGHVIITGYSSCHFDSRNLERLGLTVLNKSLPGNILKGYDAFHLRQFYLARKD